MTASSTSTTASTGGNLGATEDSAINKTVLSPAKDYRGKRVLLIVPDGTRTAPIGLCFRAFHDKSAWRPRRST